MLSDWPLETLLLIGLNVVYWIRRVLCINFHLDELYNVEIVELETPNFTTCWSQTSHQVSHTIMVVHKSYAKGLLNFPALPSVFKALIRWLPPHYYKYCQRRLSWGPTLCIGDRIPTGVIEPCTQGREGIQKEMNKAASHCLPQNTSIPPSDWPQSRADPEPESPFSCDIYTYKDIMFKVSMATATA